MRLSGSRIDFKELKKKKEIGGLLITLAIIFSIATMVIVVMEENVARTYIQTASKSIYNVPSFDSIIKNSKEYVAVMFKSATCPVCKRMYPYWFTLENSHIKGVKFYDVTYDTNVAELFQRYGIEDVPTFIIFKNGKIIARHVGAFPGPNVTQNMLNWVMQSIKGQNYVPGYQTYLAKCSMCHGAPTDLNKEAILQWARTESKGLGRLILAAYSSKKTLVQYLGSEKAIEERIWGMAKRNNLMLSENDVKQSAKFLEALSERLLGIKKQQKFENGESSKLEADKLNMNALSPLLLFLAGLGAGVAAAESPCVFPLFITHIVAAARGKERKVKHAVGCGVAAAIGVALIGVLFLAFSQAVLEFQKILLPIIAFIIIVTSLAELVKLPIEFSPGKVAKGGHAFCFLYGFLSVQCSLPLVIGALLLIAAGGGLYTLLGFSIGIGLPLIVASYFAPRMRKSVEKLMKNADKVELASTALMLIAGIYLLLYAFGAV